MKKRLLSWLMVLTLCLTLLPTAALAAEDGEDESEQNISVQNSGTHQSHCLCGGSSCNHVGGHSEESTVNFDRWERADSLPSSGTYYLTKNVTLSSTHEVTGNLTLCLNGNTITGPNANDGKDYVIRVQNDAAVFTLTDCKNNTGKITHAENAKGSGVDVAVGIFNMYGGSITGNTRSEGPGGVHVGSNSGTAFNLYGGSIIGNKAGYGGGVSVEGSGIFRMYGGTIENNTAASENNNVRSEGGGVCIYGSATFEMSGGTIENNTAAENGGGVYATGATFTVSGAAKITGNTKGTGSDSTTNNVYLPEGKTITIGGTLDNGASIGVTTEASNKVGTVVAEPAENVSLTSNDAGKFTSDNAGYEVKFDETNQKLVLKAKNTPPVEEKHEHYLCGGNSCTGVGHTDAQTTFAKPINGVSDLQSGTYYMTLAAGTYYLTGNLDLGEHTLRIEDDVTLCLNGYSITSTSGYAVYISRGMNSSPKVTFSDCKRGGTEYGKITGLTGGVQVSTGSSFTMYGGEITGNRQNGGVYMYAGGVESGYKATFTMYGGKITGNGAAKGGGVYVGDNCAFTMSGGEITGNTADENGGGVFVNVLAPGVVGGDKATFTVSGTAKITDNKVGGKDNNVYLPNGATITVVEGVGLSYDNSIGVTTGEPPRDGAPVTIIADKKGISRLSTKVFSDNEAYETAVSGNTIVLQVKGDTTPIEKQAQAALTLAADKTTLAVGETLTLAVTGGSGSGAVTYRVSDTSKATINGHTLTAAKAGTITVTATKAGDTTYNAIDSNTITITIAEKPADPTPSTPSSSGSSYTPTYPVSAPSKTEHGSVSSNVRNASKGSTVTITVKPEDGYVLDDLTVIDKNGSELKLTDKGDGRYTFIMPAGKVEIKAAFAEEVETSPFADAAIDAYYYEAVKWAADKGITGGIGNGLFGSDQPCTRAQIVTFLWRAAGSPEPKGGVAGMTDVAAGSYYEKAVAWAIENGVTTGAGDGKFSPDATCTRAQAVTFLARALNAKATSAAEFSDVPTDSYFANAVAWAAANGVTEGVGGGLFGPNNNCTRAQIVTFLWRAYAK